MRRRCSEIDASVVRACNGIVYVSVAANQEPNYSRTLVLAVALEASERHTCTTSSQITNQNKPISNYLRDRLGELGACDSKKLRRNANGLFSPLTVRFNRGGGSGL